MSIGFEDGEGSCVVRLEGEIDILSAEDLKVTLLEAVTARKDVRVEMAAATHLDVTGVQLLWAAARAVEARGDGFRVVALEPEKLEQTMQDFGLASFSAAAHAHEAGLNEAG